LRTVYKNDESKIIIYQLQAEYIGSCEKLIINWNWAYIPKIPEYYRVEFEIK
jgi:hypothetical protein